jgi:hypothetical protein
MNAPAGLSGDKRCPMLQLTDARSAADTSSALSAEAPAPSRKALAGSPHRLAEPVPAAGVVCAASL